MTISRNRKSLRFSIAGQDSRSHLLFLEKKIIPLVPLFVKDFQYNFTQKLSMTISRTNRCFRMVGPRSRSKLLFFEEKNVLQRLHSWTNFLDNFAFQLGLSSVLLLHYIRKLCHCSSDLIDGPCPVRMDCIACDALFLFVPRC